MDVYWRQGEWENLTYGDVADDKEKVAFIMGVAERGERTKTGRNQGVILDSIALTNEWRDRIRGHKKSDKIFSFSQQAFYTAWETAKAALGLDFLGPPHDLRHSGAARDLEQGTRSLEQIRRRGRWRAMDSVQRYTKTFLLVRQRARLPSPVAKRGRELLATRGDRRLAS